MGSNRGGHALNIESIKLIETRSSFKDIITALTLFDNFISGDVSYGSSCNGKMLSKLFHYTMT